jgi:hypothetical protein
MEKAKMEKTDVNVEVLEGFGGNTRFKRKWLKTWTYLGSRILRFPEYMQTIILEDVNTAIKNRIATMEMIIEAEKRRKSS